MIEEFIDFAAERQLLSVALHGNLDAFLTVPAAAFTHWINADIASAIRQAHSQGIPADLPNIARIAVQAAAGAERARQIGAVIAELGTHFVPGDGAYYAERVSDLHHTRAVHEAVETFKRKTSYGAKNDDSTVTVHALKELREAADVFETALVPAVSGTEIDSVRSILDEEVEEYDWLVPGLLERMDRLILTGFEGLGKSYLLAQIALCVGAGIHPFTQDPLPIKPYRVLIFDAENSRRQIKRRYARIVQQVNAIRERNDMGAPDWAECVRLVIKPEGFDLTDFHQLAEIHQQIEAVSPDLVVAGPLYKMSRLNVQEEQPAQELTLCLDKLRSKYGFTLICEAHAGHATDGVTRKVRPIGSSLFLRWPEFGFGIAPHPDLKQESEHPKWVQIRHWRGSREERDWPDALKHGDFLPWEPLDARYYAMVRAKGW